MDPPDEGSVVRTATSLCGTHPLAEGLFVDLVYSSIKSFLLRYAEVLLLSKR